LSGGDGGSKWTLSSVDGGTPGWRNSVSSTAVLQNYEIHSVILTEVAYDPPQGVGEWVEVLNRSSEPVNLLGWTLEDVDSTRTTTIARSPVILLPQDYMVVAEDASVAEYYGLTDGFIVPTDVFISLNN